MRLNRLDLTRYGKFTGHCIDFGTPMPDKPDLHIIYGPNEAGKSTTLSAFLDLLFGIETRSRFNFLHPHDTMRVGGSLEIGGTNYELARVKRARNTLLDGSGQPIAEAVLSGQLGSIDRESYRAMFSLDDDTLEAGGESIMASKGDLGQLLFSASTGLAELSRTLAELRAEADGFYRYHAHNTQLAIYKNRLAALKDQREQIDTVASRYAALVEARDLAKQQYDAAIADRTRIQSRMDAIQRHASALPRLTALHALRAQLQPLAELPAAPAEWHDALPALQTEATTLAVRREGLERDHAEASAALAAIVVDEAAFAAAFRLDHLNDLLARYVTAGKDIPVRALEVRQADLQIAGILGRLGRTDESDPQRLVLPAATTGTLRKLIEQYSGIETARETADHEVCEARQRLQEAREALQPAPATGGTGTDTGTGNASAADVALDAAHLAALAAAVAGVHGADFAVRRRSAQRAQVIQQDVLAERLRSLLPWRGDAEQLAPLAVPDDADLQLWQAEQTAAQQQHARREQELERATAEHARLSAERDAIVRLAGVVSGHDAAEIRAAREAAWASHRRTLDAASADIFEAALRRDDSVMDARLHHEAAAVRLQQNGEALARAEADLRHAQEEFGKAALRLERIEAQISTAAASCLPHATLASLKAWLGRRDKALEARAALRQADHDLREADEDATDLRRRLLAALSAASIPHDPAATLDMARAAAQAVLDREATVKALRDAVQDRRHELQVRDRRFKAAAERQEAWRAEWEAACAGCWLGASGTPPAVRAVQEMLTAIAELAPALERRASLLDRIGKMQDDQRDFAAEVAAVAQAMGMDAADGDPLELARTIMQRIGAARTATALRASKVEALEAVQVRRRVLAEAQRIHDARLQAMQSFFGVNSLADVAARLSDIARKTELQRQADDAVGEILDALRTASIEDAERQLAGADRAALEAELATLQARFADQDQRTRDLFSDCSKASDQVDRVGGDAAVARIEEQRRTVLLEIEEQAVRYLRLRAGIVAAEHALRSYRQQHRSAMMEEASQAFRTISRGAYSGLASQPNKDSEDLIAVAADGSSRQAPQLSKGTRFQLYLALRFAGYCEFARLRPPVPFVADDILETFDNERAEQALRLLAGIGQVGQAIYLTHHRHLCEIARQVCPDVRVHVL